MEPFMRAVAETLTSLGVPAIHTASSVLVEGHEFSGRKRRGGAITFNYTLYQRPYDIASAAVDVLSDMPGLRDADARQRRRHEMHRLEKAVGKVPGLHVFTDGVDLVVGVALQPHELYIVHRLREAVDALLDRQPFDPDTPLSVVADFAEEDGCTNAGLLEYLRK